MINLIAVGGNVYEVEFDETAQPSTALCTVDKSGAALGVSLQPGPFMSGYYGDPRPIMAAIIAMHRVRQFGYLRDVPVGGTTTRR